MVAPVETPKKMFSSFSVNDRALLPVPWKVALWSGEGEYLSDRLSRRLIGSSAGSLLTKLIIYYFFAPWMINSEDCSSGFIS